MPTNQLVFSQLIDNGMKPNWGTESHNLEKNCDILKDWSLFVNESKTVFTRMYFAGMSEVDSNDNKIRGNEEWRDTVLLGSKLYSEKGNY